MVIFLGIETTAHTFGVGVVKNHKIIANVKETYTTKSGGIIPIEAAKHHEKKALVVYKKALKEADISESSIDFLVISQGPGLAPCLIEGMKFVKEISRKLKKPIIPVNHCIAHLEIGKTTHAKNPVLLYASGANTQIISYSSGKYRIFGETLDIGLGNFIDNFARLMGIGFPGGPLIEKLAKKGGKYIELPYKLKGMDIALSGILTNLKQKLDSQEYKKEDLAFSAQETVFAMLVEASERALAHTGKNELILGGGVGCNSRLKEMCKIMCEERGAKFYCPENSLLGDNGAMIAYLGELIYDSKKKKFSMNSKKLDITPRERTDEVKVFWK